MDGTRLNQTIRPVEHRLPNGLTLLVREDRASPVVAIVTHVRAGYFDEPEPLVGISHVLEHMYFKGTERRGVGEIARATKSAGGYLNAGTIYDHTSYYTVLPSSALEMGLDIQADALIDSRIDAGELEKELQVIIQEVKRKRDSPSALATETLYELMFDVHPMRRWRMGTEEALARLTREDVLAYYRDMYRGPNIVLVVAGDVDPQDVVRRVERAYGGVPSGEPRRPERHEPQRKGARFREMSGDIAHAYAELGWRTPGTLDPDTPALDVLAVVLGQGRASRLYRGVRERGLVSGIDAYNYTPTEIGVLGISLECEPERAAAALRGAWEEVRRVRDDGIEPAEVERVRTLLEARLLRRLETAEGQANLLAEWQAHGDWRHAGEYLDRIRAAGVSEVREAAVEYLDPAAVSALVYRPASSAALGWTAGDLTGQLGEARPHAAPPLDAEPVGVAGAPIVLGEAVHDDGVVQHAMGDGTLVIKPRSRAPLVSMAVFRRGGGISEAPDTAGFTSLMMRASVKGTSARSAERIALDSERLGGAISASAGADLLSWALTVPAEHFDAGFSLLSDVALHPTFPDVEVARERDIMLSDLDRLRDDMYNYPLQLLLKAAFPDHAYGYGPDVVERAVAGAGADDLRRWHAGALGPPWVFVVGDVEPARVTDLVAERFGDAAGIPDGAHPRPEWPRTPRIEEVHRDRAQTALAIAFPAPDRNHEQAPVLHVLANAVSGLGNRLFEELRSRRSLAYTVSAYPILRRAGGAFVGYIATSPDRAAEARSGLIAELLRLRDEPPDEEEMERARRYTLGAWRIRTQTNAAQLSELASALLLGDGLDEIRGFEERIRSVDRERVRAAAERWFDPDRIVEGAVHGRD